MPAPVVYNNNNPMQYAHPNPNYMAGNQIQGIPMQQGNMNKTNNLDIETIDRPPSYFQQPPQDQNVGYYNPPMNNQPVNQYDPMNPPN